MSYPTYPETYKKEIVISDANGDKTITLEVGRFSQQVGAAVVATCGETVVHTTVALGRKVNLGYFPLSVEFIEKLYSAGTIKGSRWVKRDGKPSDDVILKARVIDRSLRPLFPEGITNEVQIVNTVFSYDEENDPDMLGLLAAAAGLAVSNIPFDGPIAGVRIGFNKETEQFTVNPTNTEREGNDLDLIVSGSGESVVMVEAGANEVTEATIVEAMVLAQEHLGNMCAVITEMTAEIGKEKTQLVSDEDAAEQEKLSNLGKQIFEKYSKEVAEIVTKKGTLQESGLDEFVAKVLEEMNAGKDEDSDELLSEKEVSEGVYRATKLEARNRILSTKVRPDSRNPEDIREIWSEVDVFPRTHGSAMFKRGATQAVTVTTLGSPSLGQLVEGIDGQETRHYMHHYNMPPYASGEAGRIGWPKRREIGHGALAERALLPMIPDQEDFPYAIHVVSEIMSSNGSTSQASVCGSTLSLMAAGVPLKKPVAGIAMGLMSDGDTYVVLSDIQGLEDHVGDMDFKVAGTRDGITAIQMDIKLKGLPREILEQALEQARTGRLHIMDEMLKAIDAPRESLSEYAPKIRQLTIPADTIGGVIGPSGKTIKGIIAETGAEIDVDEDEERGVGVVNISSPDEEAIQKAYEIIDGMTREIKEGDEYDGTVTRVESYGAFVEYLPKREGLVHVSKMAVGYVNDASEIVSVGDEVHIRVSGFKDDGKVELSMLTPEQEKEAEIGAKANRPPFRGGRGMGRGDGRGDRGRGGDRRGGRNGRGRGGDRRGGRGFDRNDRNDRGGRSGRGGRDGDRRSRSFSDRGGRRDNRGRDDRS